jgi:hypothetical protein
MGKQLCILITPKKRQKYGLLVEAAGWCVGPSMPTVVTRVQSFTSSSASGPGPTQVSVTLREARARTEIRHLYFVPTTLSTLNPQPVTLNPKP